MIPRRSLYTVALNTTSGTVPLKLAGVVNRGFISEKRINGLSGSLASSFELEVGDLIALEVIAANAILPLIEGTTGFGQGVYSGNGNWSSVGLGSSVEASAMVSSIYHNNGKSYSKYSSLIPALTPADSTLSFDALKWIVGQPTVGTTGNFFSIRLPATGSDSVETFIVTPPALDEFDFKDFGRAVDFSDNGLLALVGAPLSKKIFPGAPVDSGAAIFYRFNEVTKVYDVVEVLEGTNPFVKTKTGEAVSISHDGSTFAIASPAGGTSAGGYVDIYHVEDEGKSIQFWATIQGLSPNFGRRIELNADGTFLAINQANDSDVVVFFYRRIGLIWIQEFTQRLDLPASITRSGAEFEWKSLDITANGLGNTVAVGLSYRRLGQIILTAGLVYVFFKILGIWRRVTIFSQPAVGLEPEHLIGITPILPNGINPESDFGQCISMNNDGTKLLIGEPGFIGNSVDFLRPSGAVHEYNLGAYESLAVIHYQDLFHRVENGDVISEDVVAV